MPPIIGITLDAEEGGGYSPLPWYALRKEYFSIIAKLGAIPVGIPHEPSTIGHYIDLIDGLILTGGDFDIPPHLYGADFQHEKVIVKNARTQFEMDLTREAMKISMPILGVCAGEQLLNVLLGGTLVQHIPDEIDSALEHQQPTCRTQPWHEITIIKGTKLHEIVGTEQLKVNSNHHQAVKTVGKDVLISAVAPDGVVEAIEHTQLPFCIGVEWHPELETNEGDIKLFQSFLKACKNT